MREIPYVTVEKDKNGEWDFGVWGSVGELSFDEMQELRAMVVVAIGRMEIMWQQEQGLKPENQALLSPNQE